MGTERVWVGSRRLLPLVTSLALIGCGGGGGGEASGGGDGAPAQFSAAGASNQPPTISGTPARQVTAGRNYSFNANASDPDGDALSFGIQGRPGWANFNSATGRLSGTPGQGDVGSYGNIRITVTDGTDTAQLGAFSIDVLGTASGGFTLMWDAPLTNNDGSPLVDLAGYRIYLGIEPGNYAATVELNDPFLTSYVFDQLGPGRYYIMMTAVDQSGNESDPSEERSTTI